MKNVVCLVFLVEEENSWAKIARTGNEELVWVARKIRGLVGIRGPVVEENSHAVAAGGNGRCDLLLLVQLEHQSRGVRRNDAGQKAECVQRVTENRLVRCIQRGVRTPTINALFDWHAMTVVSARIICSYCSAYCTVFHTIRQ